MHAFLYTYTLQHVHILQKVHIIQVQYRVILFLIAQKREIWRNEKTEQSNQEYAIKICQLFLLPSKFSGINFYIRSYFNHWRSSWHEASKSIQKTYGQGWVMDSELQTKWLDPVQLEKLIY
jgi:hypothetical protein